MLTESGRITMEKLLPSTCAQARAIACSSVTLRPARRVLHTTGPNRMQDSQSPKALNAALNFVMASDIPSEHKAVLIDVLVQTLRDREAAQVRGQLAQQSQKEWQPLEITQLQTFLRDKIADSWQHADEWVMHLAAQLRRDPSSVRAKALELGLHAAVDYHLARTATERMSRS